jgi:hypothetical protein
VCGTTAEREERGTVRFLERAPPRRIVEALSFVTAGPEMSGVMTLTASLDPVGAGMRVTLVFEELPPGLRVEDSDAGACQSPEQLAHLLDPAPARWPGARMCICGIVPPVHESGAPGHVDNSPAAAGPERRARRSCAGSLRAWRSGNGRSRRHQSSLTSSPVSTRAARCR